MCGIAGFAVSNPKLHLNWTRLARELVLGIEYRGTDATGYMVLRDNLRYAKSPMRASKFVNKSPFFRKRGTRPLIVGLHTRYSTQGFAWNNGNNHPIVSKSGMLLMHNGWLVNETAIIEKFDLEKDNKVDSETILRLIEHFHQKGGYGIEASIQLAMTHLSGCFACILMSTNHKGVVWLFRRDNPLFIYRNVDAGLTVWASAFSVIDDALRMVGVRRPKRHRIPVPDGTLIKLHGKEMESFVLPPDPSPPLPKWAGWSDEWYYGGGLSSAATAAVTGIINHSGEVVWDEWDEIDEDEAMRDLAEELGYEGTWKKRDYESYVKERMTEDWITRRLRKQRMDRSYLGNDSSINQWGQKFDPYTGDIIGDDPVADATVDETSIE